MAALLVSAQPFAGAVIVRAQDAPSTPTWITPRGGKPFFVIGANYEGPVDRAWMMWDSDKFDPALIDADFARARSVGINTLRIFVQKSLRDDINAGDFSKLDTVTSLARKHGLYLIVTFTDWPEADLARAADLNGRIAAHLASEPSILAYDVKNEPQFTDIAGAIYPSITLTVPLQSPDLILAYGEPVPRSSIADYRQQQGKSIIPTRMTDDQAYIMANYYELYKEFLDAGTAWVNKNNGTTLDYMDSPDSAPWTPLLNAIDGTLSAWVETQVAAVRQADPGRPITVGYSNIVFAKLPSNRSLTFQSLHRFTPHGYSGLTGTFNVLTNLQRTFAGEPLLLEEFGYPGEVQGAGGNITGYDPRSTANLETAVWTYLYSKGFAGGAKWMLNNFPQGNNPSENSYGLFDNTGQPKITAQALKQLATVFSRSAPGTMSTVQSDASYAVSYAYTSPDGLIAGGTVYTGTNFIYRSGAPSQVVMDNAGGNITLFATDVATADLNLPGIFGVSTSELGRVTLTGSRPGGEPFTPTVPSLVGDWLQVSLLPLNNYRLTTVPRAVEPAVAQADPNTVYFPQTAHNLSGDFLRYWQTHGGLNTFGYPLSEAFTENGYTVQYFERNRFELHPENQSPYNVLLGRLGADASAGRKFPQIVPFASTPDHLYFAETGHSLNSAFLAYWQKNGGLAQFGYPISEEVKETSATDGKEYTVQYFERARFEYHPEFTGTDGQVLLGLLGADSMKAKGWLP